jgi:hypothetical protein
MQKFTPRKIETFDDVFAVDLESRTDAEQYIDSLGKTKNCLKHGNKI